MAKEAAALGLQGILEVPGRFLAVNLATLAVYVAVGAPNLAFFAAADVAPVFLAGSAVAFAAAMLCGMSAWPAIFAGAFLLHAAFLPDPLVVALVQAMAVTAAAAIGAAATRLNLHARGPMLTVHEVLALFRGALVFAAVAAAGTVIGESILGVTGSTWPLTLMNAFVPHLAGVVLVAPMLLLLWIDRRAPSRDRRYQMLAIGGAVLLGSALRLAPGGSVIHMGLPMLFLLACSWLSMRFAQREAAILFAAALTVALVSAVLQPTDASPIPGAGLMGGFAITLTMFNALLVTSLAEERRVALMLAGVDALSGIANRRTFFERASQEADRAKRHKRYLAIITFDIDNFKVVNDTHGHAAGDATIRALAGAVAVQLRRLDTLARVGGEEFAILMPETEPAQAEAVCERLRSAIAATEIRSGAATFSVTASFGLTEFDAENDTIDSALQRADRALYRAKEEGRNRVVSI
jgi:diguanylate cyclase (GGDEF)-like protein